MECGKAKFMENFTVCVLDGIEAILRNTLLDAYHIDVLRRGLNLKVIAKLTNRSVILKVES